MIKKILKYIITQLLAFFACAVVRRYRPQIVMVSGSVGKTSTKDAVAAVLATRFFVYKSEKSFNSEFGVPFTILGVENPWNNPFAWISVIKKALALLLLPNHYPNLLVLEVGADRRGDLARILKIATPDAVVITRLPEIPVHVEAYTSPEAVREEEFYPAHLLPVDAPLIISADDAYACEMATHTTAKVFSYGSADDSMIRVSNTDFYEQEGGVIGMQADVVIGSEHSHLVIKGSVGRTQILPAVAALAVAKAFNISMSEALEALENYEPPPGRGRIFAGKHGSIIIDDSYNSSPVAVEEALLSLKIFPHAKRRIAVLGDMLELGRYSAKEHKRIGVIACSSADFVVAVGIRARAFAIVPRECEVSQFENSHLAATALADFVREGDVVLIKGSQSVRTERIVEMLLLNPKDSSKLARQEVRWKRKA